MNCYRTYFQTVRENFSIKAECNFFSFIIFVNHLNTMVKIKKSVIDVKKLNAYLSRVYTSLKYPGSFSGLDKLYREVKKRISKRFSKRCAIMGKRQLVICFTQTC